ncbi:MAG: hypothetical protein ACLP4W_03200 [Mycobacterium sp.]|uniref:hypothetical protein n=1 Tax=Mycobacterium sp. TaxID=1785 RepID=UPI003F975BFC
MADRSLAGKKTCAGASSWATRPGPDGGYHGNFSHPTSVIIDYPFITSSSTPDSVLTGQKMWGW